MTDNTSTIAGNYPGGIRITCILNEGNPTITTRSFDQRGLYSTQCTYASELQEGDVVALANNSDCTYVATGGVPVMERGADSESLIIGQIVSTPKTLKTPAASTDANSLALRLAGKYYRTAIVELWGGITKVTDATVMCNGTNATVPGVGATIAFNITSGYANHSLCFDQVSSGGQGAIPLTYVAAGSDGDTYTCLVGITDLMDSVTGA